MDQRQITRIKKAGIIKNLIEEAINKLNSASDSLTKVPASTFNSGIDFNKGTNIEDRIEEILNLRLHTGETLIDQAKELLDEVKKETYKGTISIPQEKPAE